MRKIYRDDDIKVSNKESMNQEFNFASKTILVTGGSSGIGPDSDPALAARAHAI